MPGFGRPAPGLKARWSRRGRLYPRTSVSDITVVSRHKHDLYRRWTRAVLLHPDISDPCKVTLLTYALFMTESGYISVPRATIAEMLGKHPSRISEHVGAGVAAKLLDRVPGRGGWPGVTASYAVVLPSAKGYL